jgi:hypothetical protein
VKVKTMTPEERDKALSNLVTEALRASREAQEAEKAHRNAEQALGAALRQGNPSQELWTTLGDTQEALHQAEARRTGAWLDLLSADNARRKSE